MDDNIYVLILSGLTLLSNILLHMRLKHCSSLCCESDCMSKSQMNTPTLNHSRSPLLD